jgi:hypothetical protein
MKILTNADTDNRTVCRRTMTASIRIWHQMIAMNWRNIAHCRCWNCHRTQTYKMENVNAVGGRIKCNPESCDKKKSILRQFHVNQKLIELFFVYKEIFIIYFMLFLSG